MHGWQPQQVFHQVHLISHGSLTLPHQSRQTVPLRQRWMRFRSARGSGGGDEGGIGGEGGGEGGGGGGGGEGGEGGGEGGGCGDCRHLVTFFLGCLSFHSARRRRASRSRFSRLIIAVRLRTLFGSPSSKSNGNGGSREEEDEDADVVEEAASTSSSSCCCCCCCSSSHAPTVVVEVAVAVVVAMASPLFASTAAGGSMPCSEKAANNGAQTLTERRCARPHGTSVVRLSSQSGMREARLTGANDGRGVSFGCMSATPKYQDSRVHLLQFAQKQGPPA